MTDLNLLFRFRDLVAKTVDAHQEVISANGSCWWGWWKRPSEDSRADIWTALKASVTEATPVWVGLFDSGSGKVYRARVVGVVPPNDTGHSSAVAGLNRTELKLVPTYYRASPFSRAWMKLTNIVLMEDFFHSYSFSKSPDLPNYTAITLSKFAGKKILNSKELTGMDTTIWEIRPSRDGDSEESIVLSVPALPAAVSGEVVLCKSNRILHITDPHFGIGASRRHHIWRLESEMNETRHTMTDAIAAAINSTSIGAIVVTGDLTFKGSKEEFSEARLSLSKLLGRFDLGVDNLIVIPGNHDIQWGTDADYKPDAKVEAAPIAAKENYSEFYRDLFRHDPSIHLSMGRRMLLPCGLTLEIAGLNSSSLSTGRNFLAGMGKIDEAGFDEIHSALDWNRPETMALRVLAIHHHLAITENIEPTSGYPQGYGLAVDAVRIQRLAAQNRIQLALHGHKHRAFLWRSSVYDLPEHASSHYKLGEISIVGGGSAGSIETDGNSNYFNLIEFSPLEMRLDIYRSQSKSRFNCIKKFSAPFGRFPDDGGLHLGDWKFIS